MRARHLLVGLAAIVLLLVLVFAGLNGVLAPGDNSMTTLPAPPAADTPLPETADVPGSEFTDADLLSGLAASCESGALTSAFSDWSEEEAKEKILDVSRRLSVSTSSDHLLLAAYWETDPALKETLLIRAISISPAEPLLLWSAVQFCSAPDSSNSCPVQDWEQRLIAVDGSNSETWARIAANRFAAGEHEAALEAMKRASASGESRVYWTETIEMTERALRAESDFGFPERASLAIGVAAAHQPRYGDVPTMCRTQSVGSVEWAYACLAYGQLAENQVETEMGSSIARSIQRHAYEALGDLESAETVEQRSQAARQERRDLTVEQIMSDLDLMMSNQNLFFSYLHAIRAEGEVVARQRINAEIERLVRQYPELNCD